MQCWQKLVESVLFSKKLVLVPVLRLRMISTVIRFQMTISPMNRFLPFLMINNEPDDKNYNHSITFTDNDHIVTYEESNPMGSNITQFELVQPDTDTASKSSITVDVADTCRERDACSKYVNEISKSTDPADWFPIRSETVDFWINKETNLCQNKSETDGYKSSKTIFQPNKKKTEWSLSIFQ